MAGPEQERADAGAPVEAPQEEYVRPPRQHRRRPPAVNITPGADGAHKGAAQPCQSAGSSQPCQSSGSLYPCQSAGSSYAYQSGHSPRADMKAATWPPPHSSSAKRSDVYGEKRMRGSKQRGPQSLHGTRGPLPDRRPVSAPNLRGLQTVNGPPRPPSAPFIKHQPVIHHKMLPPPIEDEPLKESLQFFRKEKRLFKELKELKGWDKEATMQKHHGLHRPMSATSIPTVGNVAPEMMRRLGQQLSQDIEYHGVRSGFMEPLSHREFEHNMAGLFHGRAGRRQTIVLSH
mmetsp:Transcript_13527/g.30760  ORF Transcript_13527/g.30760 Transcript_13527/m.30760 type:complete len:288 (-) Transcript_13527:70-933(-)